MQYKRLFIDNSLIFITFCNQNKIPILIDNIEILKIALFKTIRIYKFKLIAYCVMNNHIHCIIKPKDIIQYPQIIKSFKYAVTKNVGLVKPTYSKIWQNRYWEHTIRDEEDLYRHLDYIHYNPTKHYNIAPKDYPYSSFHKFVKNGYYDINWCNFGDKYGIINLDFE